MEKSLTLYYPSDQNLFVLGSILSTLGSKGLKNVIF